MDILALLQRLFVNRGNFDFDSSDMMLLLTVLFFAILWIKALSTLWASSLFTG